MCWEMWFSELFMSRFVMWEEDGRRLWITWLSWMAPPSPVHGPDWRHKPDLYKLHTNSSACVDESQIFVPNIPQDVPWDLTSYSQSEKSNTSSYAGCVLYARFETLWWNRLRVYSISGQSSVYDVKQRQNMTASLCLLGKMASPWMQSGFWFVIEWVSGDDMTTPRRFQIRTTQCEDFHVGRRKVTSIKRIENVHFPNSFHWCVVKCSWRNKKRMVCVTCFCGNLLLHTVQ